MTERAKELVRMPDLWARPMGRISDGEFEAVFRGHYNGVYRLLYRALGSRDEAEDLAQEVFLRFYRGGLAADRPHNVRAWLYQVALNLARNARRGDARRGGREARVGNEGLVQPAEDPAEATLRGQERATVRRALAELPERQASLLLLRHSGLSYREIADALGLAPTSVGTLLARAEAAFARVYGTGEVEGSGGNDDDAV
jgi:RNA polymerase sigma-70 factor, ECF subfamily